MTVIIAIGACDGQRLNCAIGTYIKILAVTGAITAPAVFLQFQRFMQLFSVKTVVR